MPKIELKETHGCSKKYYIEIEQERLDEQIKSTVKTMKRDVQIPGFRKGKVPESILLRRFAPTIRMEAFKELIPGVLEEMFESEGIKPVNEPDIWDLNLEETGPVSFSVSVEELPEIDVSGFKGLKVTKKVPEVTDQFLEDEIENIRRRYAKQEEVERGAEKGDILVVNLQKLDSSGVPIIGDKMENHVIKLDGESTPSPEFDEKVIGMKKGDRRSIRFTYDDSINNPDLVGTADAYDVEILQVMENNIPELNDEFVKTLGDYTDVSDFSEKTRESMIKNIESFAERKLHYDLMEEFIKQTPFEVPNVMVERVIKSEIERIKTSNPETEFDESAYRTQLRPDAVRSVQSFIVVDAVKKEQNIEVAKEEVDERLNTLATLHGMEIRELRRMLIKDGEFDNIKNNIADTKAYDWIVEAAEVSVDTDPIGSEESRIIKP